MSLKERKMELTPDAIETLANFLSRIGIKKRREIVLALILKSKTSKSN